MDGMLVGMHQYAFLATNVEIYQMPHNLSTKWTVIAMKQYPSQVRVVIYL